MRKIYQIFAIAVLSTAAANAHYQHDYSHVADNNSQDYSRKESNNSQDEGRAESYRLPAVPSMQDQRASDDQQNRNSNQRDRYSDQESSYSDQNRSSTQRNEDNNQESSYYSEQNRNSNQRDDSSSQQPSKANMTVLDIINSNPHFSKFAQALKTSGIAEDLKDEDELTIFVPTDEAFQNIPQQLLRPENKEKLANILKHHVIDDTYNRADLKTDHIEALDDTDLNIEVNGHRIKVNNANVVQTDIKASNGVVHVIDAVILPENAQQAQNQNRAMAR